MKDKDAKLLEEAYGSIYNSEDDVRTDLKNMAMYILEQIEKDESEEFDIPSLVDELTDWLGDIRRTML